MCGRAQFLILINTSHQFPCYKKKYLNFFLNFPKYSEIFSLLYVFTIIEMPHLSDMPDNQVPNFHLSFQTQPEKLKILVDMIHQ